MSHDAVRRGYVYRRVQRNWCCSWNVSWEQIYLVCKDGCMFFFDRPEDLSPTDQISLYGAACIFCVYPKTNKPNCLEITTPEQTTYIYTEEQEDVKAWAISLQKAAIQASGGKLVLGKKSIMGTAEVGGAGAEAGSGKGGTHARGQSRGNDAYHEHKNAM